MGRVSFIAGSGLAPAQQPAFRSLVREAVQALASRCHAIAPGSPTGWANRLTEALMSEADASHRAVIAAMVANGIRSRDILETYVPAAAHRLGEMWLDDEASFVAVTVGVGRLQAWVAEVSEQAVATARHDPRAGSFLMIVPPFEHHSLGAFLAADQLRRHGVAVHMGIGLTNDEIVELIDRRGFAALGLTAATTKTLDMVREVVDYLRSKSDHVPTIFIGGRAVIAHPAICEDTGADLVVGSARAAVDRFGPSNFGTALSFEHSG